MKAQCVHSETGLCESCFKYETEIACLKATLKKVNTERLEEVTKRRHFESRGK